MKKYFLLILSTIVFSACEDRILIDLQGSRPQLVVDAFLTNDTIEQQIILSFSSPYLENAKPKPALDAEVFVTDAVGRRFDFTDENKDGVYTYKDKPGEFPMGIPGNFYQLSIKYNGESYQAFSKMDSVPEIDSLGYEFQPAEFVFGDSIKAGYTLTMLAKDLPNQTNGYWFKTFKNNVFYNKPGEMNLAYDAAFGPGSDGVTFIAPIIFNLSPERFQKGDEVRIEIHSIGIPTWFFLNTAQSEMQNGGLFARPPANVPTNIENINKDSKNKAIGWFSTASVRKKTVIIP